MTLIKTINPPPRKSAESPTNSHSAWLPSNIMLTMMSSQVILSTRNRWKPGSKGRACGRLEDLIMNSRLTSGINLTLMMKLARMIKNQEKNKTSILRSILTISLRETLLIRPTINPLPITHFWQEILIAKIRFRPMINLRAFWINSSSKTIATTWFRHSKLRKIHTL